MCVRIYVHVYIHACAHACKIYLLSRIPMHAQIRLDIYVLYVYIYIYANIIYI